MTSGKAPILVCVSGGGRSLANLIDWRDSLFEVKQVLASCICPAVEIAKDHGIEVMVQKSRRELHPSEVKRLEEICDKKGIRLIVLAGYLAPFPLESHRTLPIINIHPALLPKFGGKGMYGINVHRAVLAAGECETGATIHHVTRDYDAGQIIARTRVSVTTNDANELASLVFRRECELLPAVINKMITGELPMETVWEYQS